MAGATVVVVALGVTVIVTLLIFTVLVGLPSPLEGANEVIFFATSRPFVTWPTYA